MTFLHWPYPPDVIARLLPAGFRPDLHDGQALVSLTAFVLEDFRLRGLPAVTALPSFPETNVRTYVRGPDGSDGIWFLTLEAASRTTVVAARTLYGVPYRLASMEVEIGDGTVTYLSRRRTRPEAGHRIVVRPGPAIPVPDEAPLDQWLSGRWRAWSHVLRRPVVVPIRHEPWPLHHVEVDELHETLLTDVGLPSPSVPPRAQWSPAVDDVHLGLPRPRRRRRS